jgi:hypothetical protein
MQGLTLREIKEILQAPLTTINYWVSDIELTKKQRRMLEERVQNSLQSGRIRSQKQKKEQRAEREKMLFMQGQADTNALTSRELFIAGVALYWAEGFKSKHERRLGFCNSDPYMVKFYIRWLENFLKVNRQDIVPRLILNISYQERTEELKKYWSKITNIPLNQFTKTFYQQTKWKKKHNADTYKGVLRLHVKGSFEQFWKMKGWIEGLKLNLPT